VEVVCKANQCQHVAESRGCDATGIVIVIWAATNLFDAVVSNCM
jgi:hypothetical protein